MSQSNGFRSCFASGLWFSRIRVALPRGGVRPNALTGSHKGRFSPQDLENMLRDESDGFLSICRRPDPAVEAEACMETVASVVMDLGARVMRVAPDVPSLVAYEPIGLAAEPVPA